MGATAPTCPPIPEKVERPTRSLVPLVGSIFRICVSLSGGQYMHPSEAQTPPNHLFCPVKDLPMSTVVGDDIVVLCQWRRLDGPINYERHCDKTFLWLRSPAVYRSNRRYKYWNPMTPSFAGVDSPSKTWVSRDRCNRRYKYWNPMTPSFGGVDSPSKTWASRDRHLRTPVAGIDNWNN